MFGVYSNIFIGNFVGSNFNFLVLMRDFEVP